MNYKRIKKIIDKKNYVSFDVFDTLLCRKTDNPKSVFCFLESEFKKKFKFKKNVCNDRIDSEHNARLLSTKKEIEYSDIYINFSSDYSSEMIEWMKNKELEIESNVLCVNDLIYPLYEYAKKKNKKIIIETDMYLDKEFISELLFKNNIEYDYIFVSSDLGKTKRDGEMFNVMLETVKCNPAEIVHIGDSYKSDYLRAIQHKIKSVHVRKIAKNKSVNKSFENLYNLLISKKCVNKSASFNIGYKYLGPLYSGFNFWLYSKFDELNIDKVFFLSRDGNVMKKSFDSVYSSFDSKYFYLSRRSITVPALAFVNTYEEMLELMNFKALKNISYKLIKDKMGISGINLSTYENEFGFNDDTIFEGNNLDKNQEFKNFFNSVKDIIKTNSINEFKEFEKYFKKMDFCGNIAIVDIGWQGTMQKALELMIDKMGIHANIYGFYYGLKKENVLCNKKCFGYIFDNNDYSNYYKLFSFGGLFEYFFSSSDGSVLKYKDGFPVLDDNEYKGTNYIDILDEIQCGALSFVNDYKSVYSYYDFDLKELREFSLDKLFEFGCNPSMRILKLFEKLYYNNMENFYFLPQHSTLYYFFNLKKLKKDLNNSFWKIGFMKKLFKIKLPYLKIYSFFK